MTSSASFLDSRLLNSSIVPMPTRNRLSPPSPRNDMFGMPLLPEWVREFRPHQWAAVCDIMDYYEQGYKYVLLDSPTGGGKTLIAETVRRLLKEKAAYLCTTKSLQHQFIEDFPYGVLMQGRSNYPTYDHPQKFTASKQWAQISAADCTKAKGETCDQCDFSAETDEESAMHCNFCHPVQSCPYGVAKTAALAADLCITNTSYFLSEANYVGYFSGWPFVIIDEADALEPEIMSFAEVSISDRMKKKLSISDGPERKTLEAAQKSQAWYRWITEYAIPRVQRVKRKYKWSKQLAHQREYRRLNSLEDRLRRVSRQVENGNWLYDDARSAITFKPVRIDDNAPELLWKHAKRFLLMSATIISADEMAQSLGIPNGEWASVTTPSTFPVANRPIIPVPVANMSFKTKDEAWPLMAAAVQKILDKHPNERILVHTVSYGLTSYIIDRLAPTRPLITYDSAATRDGALSKYLAQPNSVILAPSFERGVDLPGDDCRVIVVCKIPFPDLKNKQIAARLHSNGGGLWYAVATVRSLVQSTGRGVRNDKDTCTSYVLDGQFINNVWKRSRNLIPAWWSDAIQWENPPKL